MLQNELYNPSTIQLSKSALANNLKFLRRTVAKNRKLSLVVKGNAYGHGIEQYIPMATDLGVDHFSVFSSDEAGRVKRAAPEAAVMIMGMLYHHELEWIISSEIEFFVFEFERLKIAAEIAKKLNKKAKIHIEVETGMNRTGFSRNDLPYVADILEKNSDFLEFSGLCTHYAGAESIANYLRVRKQKKNFSEAAKYFEFRKIEPKIKHTACSAASIRYPDTRMDMVRIGILQYGFWPSKEIFIEYLKDRKTKTDPLKRILTWRSQVMSVKDVKEGEYIGYGTSYLAPKDVKIVIAPVGYSHGFTRGLSNSGRALIHGKRVPVIGTVNMNAVTLKITNLEDVKIGDEVVLIGHQNDLEITVNSFSELSEQLNYELLTRLPQDIPRIVI